MLEIGSVVDGKYKILSEIGRGGMSVVYMAINEKANKTWAIKEVRKDGVLDFESVRQGLIVETEMLKNLKHSNLPSIVDVIDQQDIFLIVMDYIEGISLSKALSSYGVQPQETVINWAQQLCDVLGYLHTRNAPIIYRDMKPQNVMLKPDGELMLIDFGTARQFKEKNIEDTTCLGTVGYAAPEQFGGQGQTDARTDIYCLGATLYHLVTGMNPCEPPYEIRPIREINPRLSGGLERILMKCTYKDPNQRYQSCAELMYDLEHYEEIDDQYIRKQKTKFAFFLTSFITFIVMLIGGIGFGFTAKSMAVDTYDSKILEAGKETDYGQKLVLYQECIALPDKAGDMEAYDGLIHAFKEDDGSFSVEEEQLMVKLIKNNLASLQKEKQIYADLCFEMGKLFWYYYGYGDGSNNEATRMKSSVEWFEDAIRYSDEGYENYGMARVYADIGKFYRDISINTVEANDKGLYKPFYDNMLELMQNVARDEGESEIVRLELLTLVRSSVQQYATKFKGDEVSQEALDFLIDDVEEVTNSIGTTTDVTAEVKKEIQELLPNTREAIENAYSTTGGDSE